MTGPGIVPQSPRPLVNTITIMPISRSYTQDTAGEARTNSSVMYSYGPPHMAKQKQDDQLEHTYSSCVRIRDVALKTCQKRRMIGRSDDMMMMIYDRPDHQFQKSVTFQFKMWTKHNLNSWFSSSDKSFWKINHTFWMSFKEKNGGPDSSKQHTKF